MDISRSGYYKWLKNKYIKKQYQLNREDLIDIVTGIHNQYPSFGYRSINAKIKTNIGWIVSDNYVHRCCKFLGFKSKAKHYMWKKPGGESIIFPNKIKNNWIINKPLKIVVSDTTAIGFNHKGYEWTYYLDVFNNEIIGSAVGKFKHGNNVKVHHKALESMLKNKRKRGYKDQETVLHTDQGSVYSSQTFINAHKNYNINRSMSRAGTPTDNPVIESLNGWYKAAIKVDIDKNLFQDVEEYISHVVDYVNNERPSSKLKYKTPIQYRTEQGFK